MASQLLCIIGSWNSQCRRKTTNSASHKYGRVKNSTSARQWKYGHDQHSSRSHVKFERAEISSPRLENGDQVKRKKNKVVKRRSEAQEHRRLGLWYVTSCISHILRKARAFYNEFCCDAMSDDRYDTTRRQGYNHEVMSVDPYFSIPITPFTSHDCSTTYY